MTNSDTSWQNAPAKPGLPDDEVHVWRIDLDDDSRPLEETAACLTQDESLRASAFHFERDRLRFIAGRAALRRILASYCEVSPAEIRFTYGDQGKPELARPPGDSGLRFNLSHSRGLALCAVTRMRVIGVDVEKIRARSNIERVAERFFSTAENSALRSIPREQRREAFFRCWTRKEAYLKAQGSGVFGGSTGFDVSLAPEEPARLQRIQGDPDEAAPWTLRDLTPAAGFVAAVLAQGTDWKLRLFK